MSSRPTSPASVAGTSAPRTLADLADSCPGDQRQIMEPRLHGKMEQGAHYSSDPNHPNHSNQADTPVQDNLGSSFSCRYTSSTTENNRIGSGQIAHAQAPAPAHAHARNHAQNRASNEHGYVYYGSGLPRAKQPTHSLLVRSVQHDALQGFLDSPSVLSPPVSYNTKPAALLRSSRLTRRSRLLVLTSLVVLPPLFLIVFFNVYFFYNQYSRYPRLSTIGLLTPDPVNTLNSLSLIPHRFHSQFESSHSLEPSLLGYLLFTLSNIFTMTSSWFGKLATRAVFMISTHPEAQRPDRATYTESTVNAINTLQDRWYNSQTGIWDEAWWNSANAFTTLADFATVDVAAANQLNIGGILSNTFSRAQGEEVHVSKVMDAAGLVTSSYTISKVENELSNPAVDGQAPSGAPVFNNTNVRRQTFAGFINEFYDDEGWWALGLIRAYDLMGTPAYLDMAVSIFEDMKTGGNTYCNGGIFWNKERKYVNAITNELYLAVAASLANRIPENPEYLDIARRQWSWFDNSGMINSQGTINDGLDGNCNNNGDNVWTYNQGVILGALVELNKATGNQELLSKATRIARAAIERLTDDEGIMHESCEPECGADGEQFKGIFVRNLRYLQNAAPKPDFRKFILDNADSNRANNLDRAGRYGVDWSGPPQKQSGPTHSSALDTLVAAVDVV